jgi:hypothetical protein
MDSWTWRVPGRGCRGFKSAAERAEMEWSQGNREEAGEVWEWKDLKSEYILNIKGDEILGCFIFGKLYQRSTFGTRNVELPS